MQKLLFSFSAFLLVACTSIGVQSKEVPGNTLPAWVMDPPKDSRSTMWGIGEGVDLDAARRNALKDIAAKLNVAISAQLESRVTVSAGAVDRYARTRVAEEVQRTEFKNFTVEKSAPGGQGYFALVSVDRQAFIAEAEQKLGAAEAEIANRLKGAAKAGSIDYFIAQQQALPWIEKAVASAQVLSGADSGFDGNRLRKLEATLDKAKNSASGLTFDIAADADNRDVAQVFGTFLNESSIRVGRGGTKLLIEASATQSTIFGSYTVQLQINANVLSADGQSLAAKEFKVRGASMSDYRMARQAALKQLGEKLREVGPVVALGFSAT